MFQLLPIITGCTVFLVTFSAAQFPPPVTYDAVLKSPVNPNITISYKTPEPGTCLTSFPHQKQYTGYVNLPPFTLVPYQQNYSINTFFWFVEARTNPETAPLTIWLNGGPGSSSMLGMFTETGPCEVVQLEDGTYGTQPRLWGWDRSSNMLFIDQPTQTGFSYDQLVDGSLNLVDDEYIRHPRPVPNGMPAWAFLNGTFSTGHAYSTQNTSMIAASASWHFLQGFLSAFPQYNPGKHPRSNITEATGINLFAESYGGIYAAAFAEFYEMQNKKRLATELPRNSTLEIKLTSVGIINGMVDLDIQAPWFVKFAHENSYGIQAVDRTTALNALSDFSGPCRKHIETCRQGMRNTDPSGEGDEEVTNKQCFVAQLACLDLLQVALSSGRSPYDIRAAHPFSYPSRAFLEYLNTGSVQQSIGARVNFTLNNLAVWEAFARTGDEVRGTYLDSLAELADNGVRVALIYGDADIICNWRGGEEVAQRMFQSFAGDEITNSSGYADIIVNDSYVGGQLRQIGRLSFARIYDAGHTVPSYQPETAFTVFTRIIEGVDIGTGQQVDLSGFITHGPEESTHRNETPEQEKHTCWVRNMDYTCSEEQLVQIRKGEGVVRNGVWYGQEHEYQPVSSWTYAGKPGSVPTIAPTTVSLGSAQSPLTGVYTASVTPRVTSGASSLKSPFKVQRRQSGQGVLLAPTPHRDSNRSNNQKARRLRKALIATAATLGSLLLLSLISSLVLCFTLLRRPRRKTRELEAPPAARTGQPAPGQTAPAPGQPTARGPGTGPISESEPPAPRAAPASQAAPSYYPPPTTARVPTPPPVAPRTAP